jgi:Kef-type K+ transport system membrane component KefB
MLGTAMTARGEIGFLIASVAASTGLFDSKKSQGQEQNNSSEIYLVVIWAVVLCTIIGPLSVGTLVRRVKRLEGKTGNERRIDGPLGVWGLD